MCINTGIGGLGRQDGGEKLKKMLKFPFFDIFRYFVPDYGMLSGITARKCYCALLTSHGINIKAQTIPKKELDGGKNWLKYSKFDNFAKYRHKTV